MKDTPAIVTYKEPIGEKYVRLKLKVGWDQFVAGQFVMVEILGHGVFLRRPFGIVRCENQVLEICFKIVGKGTTSLSKTNVGETLLVLGPLGNGFKPSKDIETAILVGGGYGIVPLFPLARSLMEDQKNVIVYYGAKTASDLLYCTEIRSMGVRLKLATEDGSEGFKGLVTKLLESEVAEAKNAALFSAGPQGLLREVARIASSLKIPAQISLERYMACGTGVCLGCVVKAKDGSFVRACREGPVFGTQDILWDEVIKS